MSDSIDTKTMRSLVEAANGIDRTTIEEGRPSKKSPSNAAKIPATQGHPRVATQPLRTGKDEMRKDNLKDFKKRVASYFKSMGTNVNILVSPAAPSHIATIDISYQDSEGHKRCSFMRRFGKWTVNYSGVSIVDTPIETAQKQIRDQAEYFIRLSQAVKQIVALLTDFYGDADPFSS